MTTQADWNRRDSAERLEEIKGEIKALIGEALELVPDDERGSALHSWYSNIQCALDGDHGWVDRSATMQSTIDEMSETETEDDDGGESDG